jgi:hypothetical protein
VLLSGALRVSVDADAYSEVVFTRLACWRELEVQDRSVKPLRRKSSGAAFRVLPSGPSDEMGRAMILNHQTARENDGRAG